MADHTRRRLLDDNFTWTESAPLFPGLGTHFVYIFVGTPRQRRTVIVDTGSHLTAFPCQGCQCGEHMNAPYNPRVSKTSSIPVCPGFKNCPIIQSYSEGSSWNGFKVRDEVQIGGPEVETASVGRHKAIPFYFGCQVSETGMFRSQHVDGIMGLSSDRDTWPHQLYESGVTKSPSFAMCFNLNGGFISFGGIDRRQLPAAEDVKMSYLKLVRSSGFYTVRLLDVRVRDPSSASRFGGIKGALSTSLGASVSWYNTGRGCIIDSGTTDTYLPQAVKSKFESIFLAITGLKYTTDVIALTDAQLKRMPTYIFQIESEQAGSNGDMMVNSVLTPFVNVEMPPESYVEKVDTRTVNGLEVNSYIFRIFLTEGSGTVLGSNFMNNHYLLFDAPHQRVGVLSSSCSYTDPASISSTQSDAARSSDNAQQKSIVSNILPSFPTLVPTTMRVNVQKISSGDSTKNEVISLGGALRLYDGVDGFQTHSAHLLLLVFFGGWIVMLLLLVLLQMRRPRYSVTTAASI